MKTGEELDHVSMCKQARVNTYILYTAHALPTSNSLLAFTVLTSLSKNTVMVVPRGTSSSLSLGLFSVTCVARSSKVASTGEEALVLASLADIRRGTPECPRWGEEGEEGEEGGGR